MLLAALMALMVHSVVVVWVCGWNGALIRHHQPYTITTGTPLPLGTRKPPSTQRWMRRDTVDTSFSNSPSLEGLLQESGFASRLCTVALKNLSSRNVWAEVVIKGDTYVALVTSITVTNQNHTLDGSSAMGTPKLAVSYFDPTETVVTNTASNVTGRSNTVDAVIDFGQVTTIWNDIDPGTSCRMTDNWWHEYYRYQCDSHGIGTSRRNVDAEHELSMDRLYQSRIGRTLSTLPRGTQILTKKQIATLIANYYGADDAYDVHDMMDTVVSKQPQRMAADSMLRQLCKTGPGFSRLVDSSDVSNSDDFVWRGPRNTMIPTNQQTHGMKQRVSAAQSLASDSMAGGRFKRWPCLFVGYDHRNSVISFVNGGWLVTDPSVRAGTEARKFVERGGNNVATGAAAASSSFVATVASGSRTLADTRILRRLECLAMGELTAPSDFFDNRDINRRLELDVRETLNALNLPLNPEGAKRALVQTGHWSESIAAKLDRLSQSTSLQPWSPHVLDAANWFADYITSKHHSIDDEVLGKDKRHERTDLRQIPCVSIDAARASFRDDAVGVRKRASTGRMMVPGASQWEILVHIADVSDIYADHGVNQTESVESTYVSILRGAAESRGSSRYDLPLGPLHLLPPVVLRALAFPDTKTSLATDQRCVTLWAYIDERDGRLLDCGIERTLTSASTKLSFAEATSIMDDTMSQETETSRAILLVVERNLKKWNEYQRKHNEATKKREVRLRARESSSRNVGNRKAQRDDGRDGFKRSRGHRLVDTALDLYSVASSELLRRANAPVPRAIGADASRGGRFATAPLRRYIDGQGQRQLLAVMCNYGHPMSLDGCKEAAQVANRATNAIANVRSIKSR